MKTRVYVEKSRVANKYYAQVQRSFFGLKYWDFVDAFDGSTLEMKAVIMASDKLNQKYNSTTEEFAQAVCQNLFDLHQQLNKLKEDQKEHRKSKKIYTYLWPED